ncbi:MAG: peptide-methionine (R)-S-oxide reductase MsrB [Gammaproteobacteria bacterium]|nr:peptide-methionine (R)-S-oxide reductase MsrB [Gammaproteobacteria bacterium]NVK87337.1 peptide-methionine (R)-S-oxide reductase MsrB [Gammaproteobacteria bacterium]
MSNELKDKLSAEAFHVTQEKGTEAPGTGKYYLHEEDGTYYCICCNAALFSSDEKFHSGCGWPSFAAPIASGAVIETPDYSHGMVRTEITCSKCGAHLGHVFPDGPSEMGGMRYCINSVALDFSDAHSSKERKS